MTLYCVAYADKQSANQKETLTRSQKGKWQRRSTFSHSVCGTRIACMHVLWGMEPEVPDLTFYRAVIGFNGKKLITLSTSAGEQTVVATVP